MVPRRIVFAGSSSIHGRGDTAAGGFVHRFRLWHESRAANNFVYELGIVGESTSSLLSRVATETNSRRPHLIALYPGFNDIRRDGSSTAENTVSPQDFEIAMTSLISRAESVAPVLMMTGFPFDEVRTTPYPGSEAYYLHQDATIYTKVLRDVCTARGTPVLDYFSLWSSLQLDGLLTEDGLHASPAGHQLLFEQLRDFMLEQYC